MLGATGQLGTDLCRAAPEHGWAVVPLGHDRLELTDAASVRSALEAADAAVVVNAAAFPQVDRCEDDPDSALAINALGALNVARAAGALSMHCLHISTDYVFDGAKPGGAGRVTRRTGYVEDDATGPLNVYGASKLAGEALTRAACEASLIVRVSSLFGSAGSRVKGGNFVETILARAKAGVPLSVVSDQYMTPTYTVDAARAILGLAADRRRGIVHVTAPDACTWYDLAESALALTHNAASIAAVRTADSPSRVRRPANSALCTDKLTAMGIGAMRSWRDALRDYLIEKGHLEGARVGQITT